MSATLINCSLCNEKTDLSCVVCGVGCCGTHMCCCVQCDEVTCKDCFFEDACCLNNKPDKTTEKSLKALYSKGLPSWELRCLAALDSVG